MVKVKRYRTLNQIMRLYFGNKSNRDGYWEWHDEDGKRHRMRHKTALKNIKKRGTWGFIDDKKLIHCWVSSKAKFENVIQLFAHELGHRQKPWHNRRLEEIKANKYGSVAKMAYQISKDLMP
jgi:uncharacterized protein YjaZ